MEQIADTLPNQNLLCIHSFTTVGLRLLLLLVACLPTTADSMFTAMSRTSLVIQHGGSCRIAMTDGDISSARDLHRILKHAANTTWIPLAMTRNQLSLFGCESGALMIPMKSRIEETYLEASKLIREGIIKDSRGRHSRSRRQATGVVQPHCREGRIGIMCYTKDIKSSNLMFSYYQVFGNCLKRFEAVRGGRAKRVVFKCYHPYRKVFQKTGCCGPCCQDFPLMQFSLHPGRLGYCKTVQPGRFNQMLDFLKASTACLQRRPGA